MVGGHRYFRAQALGFCSMGLARRQQAARTTFILDPPHYQAATTSSSCSHTKDLLCPLRTDARQGSREAMINYRN